MVFGKCESGLYILLLIKLSQNGSEEFAFSFFKEFIRSYKWWLVGWDRRVGLNFLFD